MGTIYFRINVFCYANHNENQALPISASKQSSLNACKFMR